MNHIETELKRYKRKTRKTTSEGEDRTYYTTQYIITLRKEEVERENFLEVDRVAVIPESDFKDLLPLLDKGRSYDKLLENWEALTSEKALLENKHNHTKALNNKLQRQLNDIENENLRLQNRGVFDLIIERLRGEKKNKALPEGKA